jgi:hypothetical protein
VRVDPLTAAQSPLPHTTTEFAAVVVSVADGAPVPAVDTVAGVAANCALVHLVAVRCAFNCPDCVATVEEIVDEVPPEVTVVVHNAIQVWLAVL